jgi:hypothetical protein
MHKNATKCNETLSKWCKNKHGASKIMDSFETYLGGCSRAGEVGAEATDHAEVVLVLEKWRLFSAFHQFQQLSESPKISYWRINSFAKSEFSLNLHIYDEFSLNLHIYAGFYYVALALWLIADFHVLGQHHPLDTSQTYLSFLMLHACFYTICLVFCYTS